LVWSKEEENFIVLRYEGTHITIIFNFIRQPIKQGTSTHSKGTF